MSSRDMRNLMESMSVAEDDNQLDLVDNLQEKIVEEIVDEFDDYLDSFWENIDITDLAKLDNGHLLILEEKCFEKCKEYLSAEALKRFTSDIKRDFKLKSY